MCKKELVVSIFKKGDLRDCNSWRGETLLPIISKIFHRMLLERIKKGIEKKLKKEQGGFRPNGNTTEQIFTLKKHLRAGKRLESESAHALWGL